MVQNYIQTWGMKNALPSKIFLLNWKENLHKAFPNCSMVFIKNKTIKTKECLNISLTVSLATRLYALHSYNVFCYSSVAVFKARQFFRNRACGVAMWLLHRALFGEELPVRVAGVRRKVKCFFLLVSSIVENLFTTNCGFIYFQLRMLATVCVHLFSD